MEKIDTESPANGDEVDVNLRKAISDAMEMMPNNVTALHQNVRMSIPECLNAQTHLSVGSYCLLSSRLASSFMLSLDKQTTSQNKNTKLVKTTKTKKGIVSKNTAESHLLNFNDISNNGRKENLIVKISQEDANKVVDACLPLVYASCLMKKIDEVRSSMTSESKQISTQCSPDLTNCLKNPSVCNTEQKTRIFETFFHPFGSRLTGPLEVDRIDDWLTMLVGSFWEKTKDTISGTYEIVSHFTKLNYKKITDLTQQNYERFYSLFLGLEERILGQEWLGYRVSSEGQSVASDADPVPFNFYSQNAPLFPALIGLLFLLAQMFF